MAIKNAIKIDEAVRRWQSGHRLLFGEYRGSKAEEIRYRDKTTRNVQTMKVLRHIVEVGDDAIMVAENVEDDFDVQNFQAPFQKGQKVLVELQSLAVNRGVFEARGLLVPVAV